MRDSLIIVGFFVLGIVFGMNDILPDSLVGNSSVSFGALCALMFFVGVSVGSDSKIFASIRSVNPRLMLLPLMTIVGTLAGTAAASFLFPRHGFTDCLAVGSGFGYYSLSSIFITEYRGAELGTVALLANISRELIALLCAPLLVKFFGKTCSYFCRWSHDDGHHFAYNIALFRPAVCHAVCISRFLG